MTYKMLHSFSDIANVAVKHFMRSELINYEAMSIRYYECVSA
jgi:hypothetical protein